MAISPYRFPAILAGAAALVVAAYGVSQLLLDCRGEPCADVELYFHLSREANLPTWFSSTLWLVGAGLAAATASAPGAGARALVWHWRGLVALCVFLSLDEASMFHETFGALLGRSVSAGDVLFYDWLLYGFLAVAVVAALYIPFVRALPRDVSLRFVLAGAVFVSGAIGAESVAAASAAGAIDLIEGPVLRTLEAIVEEFLEMLGIVLLIHPLLYHLARYRQTIRLSAH